MGRKWSQSTCLSLFWLKTIAHVTSAAKWCSSSGRMYWGEFDYYFYTYKIIHWTVSLANCYSWNSCYWFYSNFRIKDFKTVKTYFLWYSLSLITLNFQPVVLQFLLPDALHHIFPLVFDTAFHPPPFFFFFCKSAMLDFVNLLPKGKKVKNC